MWHHTVEWKIVLPRGQARGRHGDFHACASSKGTMASSVCRGGRERLGPEGTAGLVDLFHHAHRDWTTEVLGLVGDRFERRLIEEASAIRREMTAGFAALRGDMTEGFAAVRGEMRAESAALRREMSEGLAAVRVEMAQGATVIRQEMAALRFDILKWAFLFWIGQFFAMASLVALLIRFLQPGRA